MKHLKQRLEAFSDGVIAIIITIMVLNIPLPEAFAMKDVMGLLNALLVYFVSFFLVGSQWNKHRYLFSDMGEAKQGLIWWNLLYLFFLSLIPIFTKWMIQHPDEVVPALGYDLVFLCVNLSFQILFHVGRPDIRRPGGRDQWRNKESRRIWFLFLLMLSAILGALVLSFFYPRVSVFVFLVVPVVTAVTGLVFDDLGRRKQPPRPDM